MRKLVMMVALATAATLGCGSVDDPPLGGPFGGTTGGTDPNGGQSAAQDDAGGGGGGGGGGNTDAGGGGGGGGSTDSGSQTTKDSGGSQQTQDSGSQQQQNAPTWTQVYASYLSGSSVGRCSSCHSQCSTATKTYSWLAGKGYINGKSSALVNSNQSCLSWYGGNMPPGGGSNSAAVKDMNAWAAAGAANN